MGGEYTANMNILGLVFFSGTLMRYKYKIFIIDKNNLYLKLLKSIWNLIFLDIVILGITLAKMGEAGKPLLDFFVCMSEAMMTITTWVIYMAPVGVFFLIGGQVLEMADFATVAQQLGFYFGTVLIGLGIHGFVVLPIVYSICTRKLPFTFIANMTNAFTTAFGTASSTATLPVTMNLLEEKNGVDPRISRSIEFRYTLCKLFFQEK